MSPPRLLPGLVLALACASCAGPETPEAPAPAASSGPAAAASSGPAARPPIDPFTDATRDSGLDFHHFNGGFGTLTILEATCAGCALFDADGDGDLDAYLVQGAMLGGQPEEKAVRPRVGPPGGRLFRNDLGRGPAGQRTARFVDVTEASGIRATGYGIGAATADVDDDGDVDLYLTFHGANQLWRNRGDGTFEEVAKKAGVDDDRWSTSASFFDADRDGDLDLLNANYIDFRVERSQTCFDAGALPDYCGPSVYPQSVSAFYRNRGDGTFEDRSLESGIGAEKGPGLGTIAADFDGDGWQDVFVANDGQPNKLWKGSATGRFTNVAMRAGCALNADGKATASMGIAVADFDDDGDDDIAYTNLRNEGGALQLNDGKGRFRDVGPATGLTTASLMHTAFGTAWLDFDADSDLDLFIANGAVRRNPELVKNGDPLPLRETNQLLENDKGRFRDISATAGPALALSEVSRGLSTGDVDEDGDLDLLFTNNDGPARLFLNRAADGARWAGLRLLTTARAGAAPRDALGAVASLTLSDGRVLRRDARTDGSIFSARDPRLVVGLGREPAALSIARLVIAWPEGTTEEFDPPPIGQYTSLVRGTGRAVAPPATAQATAPDTAP